MIVNEPQLFSDTFKLSPEVGKALEILGYLSPMPVQRRVIPYVLEGKDLIVQSKTGSGKTAAFGIPIIECMDTEEPLPQTLILAPTRELAVQVCEEIASIGRYKKIRCLPIYGKQDVQIQLKQLKQRVHVTVGTPGRVSDLINRKKLVTDQIKYLVIDEADELLKRGFLEDVVKIIQKLPTDRTTLLFSATMPPEIETICARYMIEPMRIEVESDEAPIDQIKQHWYEVAEDWKYTLLQKAITELKPESCMIFCNTRTKSDFLIQKMMEDHYDCMVLHGGMAQKERLRAINAFKNKEVTYLVATDLAARGIHIDSLDLVVNYSVPSENENYVHRIGRTGRVGEKGRAITFVNTHEIKKWAEIQEFIGYKVPLDTSDLLTKSSNTHSSKSTKETHKTEKSKSKPLKEKKKQLNSGIMRIRINAGKSKKIRPGDIQGAISNIPGILTEDIGIIDIQDTCTYVEIFHGKGDVVAEGLTNGTVKGKSVTVKKV